MPDEGGADSPAGDLDMDGELCGQSDDDDVAGLSPRSSGADDDDEDRAHAAAEPEASRMKVSQAQVYPSRCHFRMMTLLCRAAHLPYEADGQEACLRGFIGACQGACHQRAA